MAVRVVFDTNTVLSALLFGRGRLAWLRQVWRQGMVVPIVSAATRAEIERVLAYPKFRWGWPTTMRSIREIVRRLSGALEI
jgi:predicted nucleic acid-binding protein